MQDQALPLTAHLTELRSRIVKILLAWGAASAVAWTFAEPLFQWLLEPAIRALEPTESRLQAIAPTEIFFTYLKAALLGGFVLSLPVFFWQVWAFVAPGLYPSEKKVAVPFVVVSTLLFTGGAAFGYEVVFPLIFRFFADFSSEFVESAWTMREVFALTTRLILAFGIGFELPVVVFFLSAAGLVTPGQLMRGAKYALLGAFVLGAMLTPPDVVSQILLAGPLMLLYLAGVAVAWVFQPRRRKQEDAEESAALEP